MVVKVYIQISFLFLFSLPSYASFVFVETLGESAEFMLCISDDPKQKNKLGSKNNTDELMAKASSDSLYKVIFGSLPKNTLSDSGDKENDKRNKKGQFSFKMTDKVKPKSAFY